MMKSMRPLLVRGLVALILLLGLPTAGLALYWLATLPDVAGLAATNPSSTALIETRTREASAGGRPSEPNWTWVPLSRISPHVQRAVIAAEDASFYSHEGFDWSSLWGAATRNWEVGRFRRGGSTITQQLAKNLYLSSDKTLLRKAHEALITHEIERRLSKRRILELYLNVVEWGRGVYGIEAAAQHHFGKSALDLTPQEAALLAAILPSPRRYDPLPQRLTPYLTLRQQQILRWMGENGATKTTKSVNGKPRR
ncbi:MAG: monofunctional biosynthetic peptidoglycan transglycosylase [Nitrospirae bacterium]|nr:MAG: monofunctional biosynthetic peptidoglycan transglycosylase [Nitrospirota bacterium]